MYKTFLILLILFTLCSCKTKKGIYKTNYYQNNTKESEGRYIGVLKIGVWKYYYPNGMINSIVHYSNGDKDGHSLEFDRKGRITSDVTYKKGHFGGIAKFYYSNGNINFEEYHNKKGLTQGVFKLWYQSGKLNQIGTFKNGKMVGKWNQYYENGGVKSKSYYDFSGMKDSIWSFYSPSGSLIKREKYKADSLIQVYNLDTGSD